jgi:hypothetical protein
MLLQALRLLQAAATRRLRLVGGHARARATHVVLLSAFGLVTLVYLLALATVALAQWLGVMGALAIMAGAFALGAIVVLLVMRAEARAHAATMARQTDEDQRMLQSALIGAAPAAIRGGGGLLAAAAGLLTAVTLFRRSRRARRRDRPRRADR